MGREFVTASIFCLLCATHAHCSSHHDMRNSHLVGIKDSYNDGGGGNAKSQNIPSRTEREIYSGDPSKTVDYVGLVFEKYGDGKLMTRSSFSELLDSLGLAITVKTSQNKVNDDSSKPEKNTSNLCVSIMSSVKESGVSKGLYRELCPRILYQLVPGIENGCFDENHKHDHAHHHHDHENDDSEETNIATAWVYATVSVLLISLCGLLAVAVIPLMQMSIYQGLLQFLVALAVGTLCGDALLHLLPHAMMAASHSHDHNKEHEDQHHVNLLRGLVAALSVVFFYFIEKCLSIMTDWHKSSKRKTNMNTRVRVMREEHGNQEESRVGEKLCKHKYSSYPYCYGEIANNPDAHQGGDSEINNAVKVKEENGSKSVEGEEIQKDEGPNSEKQLLEINGENGNDYTTVILREHETRHHGHAHTHGHVHSAPESLSSVAWMVIMGDGIHNLTDGLAIGAAFAANIGGGVSTAVAVFCHELPHEIGDFAVLLKAGMSAKQAVFYNMLSSLLCLMGMSVGVMLGHNDHIKLWVFSAAAGMFLYIALVDMIPELTSAHTKEGGSVCQCLLQLLGLLAGIGIMLLIAVYEHDLMNSFKNKF